MSTELSIYEDRNFVIYKRHLYFMSHKIKEKNQQLQ